MKFARLCLLVCTFILPMHSHAFELPWYVGVSGGGSLLQPDTQNSGFTLDSEVSFGAGLFAGIDVTDTISVELGYNYLGAAKLSNQSGKTDIGYTAASAGALWYFFGNANDIAERNGFMGFARAGVNSMSNQHTIPLEREDSTSLWAGIGVEWPFANKLNVRAELNTFDGDAQAARVSVLFRPGSLNKNVSVVAPPRKPVQAPKPQPQPVPEPQPQPEPEQQQQQQQQQQNTQPDNSVASSDCATPSFDEPVDRRGCALFSGTVSGVEFSSGTAQLTGAGVQAVNSLATQLRAHPAVVIEIQSHTESFGNPAGAKEISRQRAIAVARQLASQGVSVKRLRARAFGNTVPLASESSAQGRAVNNRIELRVLR